MVKTRFFVIGLTLFLLALAACGPRALPEPTATPFSPVPGESLLPTPGESLLPSPGESLLPTPNESPLGEPTVARPALTAADTAVFYLANQLGVAPEEITVVSTEAVDWSDSSLGCPQPGVMYAQVITPGFKFVLSAGGQEYAVHTDEAGQSVTSCEDR